MDDALLADNRGRDLESRFCRLSDPAGQGSGGATARALNYTWRDHDMLYRKVIRRGLRMAADRANAPLYALSQIPYHEVVN
jgi:hypothetical protein